MKPTTHFRLTLLAGALAFGVSFGGSAALTDISQQPLATSSGNLVKPNISYVLDASGSMAWSHAPDEAQPWVDNVGYKTSQCNSIYYNPNIIYPPARNYDGTAMPNSSFTAAPSSAFSAFDSSSSTNVDLSANFQAYTATTGNTGSGDTAQKAYYYNYLGSQQASGANFLNKSSAFYQECNLNETANPYTTITFSGTNETAVSSITVNGSNILSGPTSTETDSPSLAADTQANVSAAGYTATVSGSTVTITAPNTTFAGVLPVVNLSPPTTLETITFGGSSNTSVTGITVNGVQIMSGATSATTSASAQAAAVASAISLNGYIATVGTTTSTNKTVTIYGPGSAAGYTPSVSMQGNQTATVTFSGSTNSIVSAVRVGGTNILAAPTSATTSSSTQAANVDTGITATGYTATHSGSVVTITAPPSAAGTTPVVTVVPATVSTTLSVYGSGSTSVSGITVGGLAIMGSASSSASSTTSVAANIDAAISQQGCSATSSGSTVTVTCPGPLASGQTPVVTVAPAATVSTLTFTGNTTTTVSNIKVGGVTITSGASSNTANSTTMATSVAGKITLAGYSATSSGAVVTITGPAGAAGSPPVLTRTGSPGTMTYTTTNFAALPTMNVAVNAPFSGGTVMSASSTGFVSGGVMTVNPTAFPAPGTMQAAVRPFSPFVKVIVSSTSGVGGTDERLNFANWYTYYRTRMLMMKSGLGRAFVSIGNNYRVGFMILTTTPGTSATSSYLPIGDFTTTQKQNWFTRVYSQTPNNSTPLKTALSTAARNLAGKVGPDPQQYSCQQNFILMSTDGYWNAGTADGKQLDGSTDIGNQDNTLATAPRPQYDGGIAAATNTLADVSYYYYNTDLRPTSGSCNTGVSGADVCNDNVPTSGLDNATWQHVTLFTLGLGTNGLLNYATNYLTGGSADYNAIVGGTKDWPSPTGDTLTTIDDLWHAAVNGHGQYFSAKNPDLLVSGLNTALAGVSARLAAGAAAATSNLEPVQGDNFAFVGSYTTQEWSGDLQSRTIDLTNGALSTTPNWSAQATLDTAVSDFSDTRTIFTFLGGSKVSFVPGSFSSTQKTNWFTPVNAPQLSQYAGWTAAQIAAGTADTVINYLRGQWGNEERGVNPAVNQLFRVRAHVLGDIIDGKPVYMRLPPFQYTENGYPAFKTGSTVSGRTGTVYVGANDGMMHAFDATNGNEIWAYIPSFVLPNLKALASDDYATNHKYYVDGSPVVTDIWNGSAWKTILVGGLAAGGKGYFALDVTTPSSPAVLWEYSDTNLGFTFGNPVVGKTTDGTWNVFFTSGYNNVGDGVGRLYAVNAWTGAQRFTISTGVGTTTSPSGLNKISGWTDNGLVDNTVQRIYGGDLFGNLWRFDINNQYPPTGQDALALGNFQVGTYQQPITTAPEAGLVGSKVVVYAGTGRYLGASDVTDTNQQSLYAVVDNLTGTGLGNVRTETTCPLVQQTLTVLSATSRSTSTLPVDLTTKCGWFLDFNPAGGNTPGERVNVDMKLQLGVLSVGTNVPQPSVCTSGGVSWLYFFDYASGRFVSTSTNNVAGQFLGNALLVGFDTIQLPNHIPISETTKSDDTHDPYSIPTNPASTNIGKRVMWRELLQ